MSPLVPLRTDRIPGTAIESADINAIASRVNTLSEGGPEGPPGEPGDPGPAGPPGGAPLGVDVWNSEPLPASVTDWGPIINTLLVAGTREFLFQPKDFPFHTKIDGRFLRGIKFVGNGSGSDWYEPGRTDALGADTGHSRLIWTGGAGTGVAVDMSSTATGDVGNIGFVMEDMFLLFNNTAYNGTLLKTQNAGFSEYNRCHFSIAQDQAHTGGLAVGVSLDGINTANFRNCTFGGKNSFSSAIRGREAGSGYSNVVRFESCTFSGGANAAITNPGLDWVFDACVFEFPELADNKAMITTDTNYTGDSIAITLIEPQWWDAVGGHGYKAIYLPAGNYADVCIINGKDHNSFGSLTRLYDIQTAGSLRIEGGNAASPIDVGDASVAGVGDRPGPRKGLVSVKGLVIRDNDTDRDTQLLNTNSGHHRVDTEVSIGDVNQVGVGGQVRTHTAERLALVDIPTIALYSGVTGLGLHITGNQGAGFMSIWNTAGDSATGRVVEVTLPSNIKSHNVARGSSGQRQFPIVMLSPMKAGYSDDWVAHTVGAFWTCKPEVEVETVYTSAGAMTKFWVRFNAALPAGQCVGIAYRVMHH